MLYHQLLYHLFRARKNLRRNKSTKSILAFELTHEKELMQLAKELHTQTYSVSAYRCFIIRDPVQREIFAAKLSARLLYFEVGHQRIFHVHR